MDVKIKRAIGIVVIIITYTAVFTALINYYGNLQFKELFFDFSVEMDCSIAVINTLIGFMMGYWYFRSVPLVDKKRNVNIFIKACLFVILVYFAFFICVFRAESVVVTSLYFFHYFSLALLGEYSDLRYEWFFILGMISYVCQIMLGYMLARLFVKK